MKTYRAVIEPKPDVITADWDVPLLRLEMVFSVGNRAPIQSPRRIVERTLFDLHIHLAMDITSLEEVEET